jgi:LPLT family lysophospholipid transporter-like MFS transporter
VRDFSHCNSRLWHDKLGQISLATTTLFWGVAGNLRYIVLAWAAARWATDHAGLQPGRRGGHRHRRRRGGGVDAMRLDRATSVIPLGIAHGPADDLLLNVITTSGWRPLPHPARRRWAAFWWCR